MIKNRYYSLIKKEQKNRNEDIEEDDLVTNILKRLKGHNFSIPIKIEEPKRINF